MLSDVHREYFRLSRRKGCRIKQHKHIYRRKKKRALTQLTSQMKWKCFVCMWIHMAFFCLNVDCPDWWMCLLFMYDFSISISNAYAFFLYFFIMKKKKNQLMNRNKRNMLRRRNALHMWTHWFRTCLRWYSCSYFSVVPKTVFHLFFHSAYYSSIRNIDVIVVCSQLSVCVWSHNAPVRCIAYTK